MWMPLRKSYRFLDIPENNSIQPRSPFSSKETETSSLYSNIKESLKVPRHGLPKTSVTSVLWGTDWGTDMVLQPSAKATLQQMDSWQMTQYYFK